MALDSPHLKNCYCEGATHIVQSDKLRRHPELVHLMANNPLPQSLPRGRKVKKLASPFTLHPSLKNKAAFTLAEVLITLGIIGVVATLTLPAVVGNYKKQQTIAKLKKAYSAINQALQLSEADNGEYSIWNHEPPTAREYLEQYWLPYFKVTQICDVPQDCGYESNSPYKTMKGDSNPFTLIIPKYRLPFLTSDGILYNISLGFSDSNDKIIFVDINGSKKPNILGKDTFAFIGKPLENRNIIVGYCHENDKTQIDNECSENGQGFCCAEKIMRENWQINYKF